MTPALTRAFAILGAPVLSVAAVATWAASIHTIDPYKAGPSGLVLLLPALWWVSLALAVAAIATALRRCNPSGVDAVCALVSLAFILHGTLPASEPVPRFDAAYSIAGFTDLLARTGHILPRVDARMSWFGLFSGAGMVSRAMHVTPLWFLRWAPLTFELAYLFPLKALANASLKTDRARWAALALFLASNWIDQDYFSPQALALLLYLVICTVAVRSLADRTPPVLLTSFTRSRPWAKASDWGCRLLKLPFHPAPSETSINELSSRQRASAVLVVLLLGTVLVVVHQASPVALTLVLLALAVFGRTRLRFAGVYLGFLIFAWLSWAGEPYWKGHLAKVFGGVGNVNSTLQSSVGARAAASTMGRAAVELSRYGAALVIWIAAIGGVYYLWRRGRTTWSMVILACAPVAIGGATSYGGEIALRILLFSLAPLAILISGLVDEELRPRRGVAAFSAVFILLLSLFPLARYGNESFEAFAPTDASSAAWVHRHVPLGSDIYVFSGD
ncbi:MAG: hypothetical protein ACYDEN_11015, partial [Acidimicrobiales bacterium]